MELMNGDQLAISIQIKDKETQEILTNEELENVEIALGNIVKDCSKGVYYYENKWYFPLTQEETFQLKANTYKLQLRIKPKGGNYIRGINVASIYINESISKVIL